MPRIYHQLSVALVIAIPTLACHGPEPTEVQQLRWVENADPVADARLAVSKHDYRFRALLGLGIFIPGTKEIPHQLVEKQFGYTIIEGTSDCLVNEEHQRLVQKAYAYAEAYNLCIIRESKAIKPQ